MLDYCILRNFSSTYKYLKYGMFIWIPSPSRFSLAVDESQTIEFIEPYVHTLSLNPRVRTYIKKETDVFTTTTTKRKEWEKKIKDPKEDPTDGRIRYVRERNSRNFSLFWRGIMWKVCELSPAIVSNYSKNFILTFNSEDDDTPLSVENQISRTIPHRFWELGERTCCYSERFSQNTIFFHNNKCFAIHKKILNLKLK